MIAFRTNSSSVVGIGHLARCYRLAIELLHKGYTCFFYIDHESDFLRKYLHPFTIHFLYDFNNAFLNDKSDALFFQNLLPSNIQAIVVDDYRFSKCWELSVSSLEVPIIVFDDMNCEQHYCSLLIDGKWEGELTQYRYQSKTNIECIKLLGPKYVFVDYLNYKSDAQDHIDSVSEFKIILSIGGGGDMSILSDLIKNLLNINLNAVNYTIYPVVGPYAINQNLILNLAEKNCKVIPILNTNTLFNHLKEAHLYIGSAGTTLYEALIADIPSITFSMSSNQLNNLRYIEDLGHFFHLNQLTNESFKKISKLTWLIFNNYNRVKNFSKFYKKISLDSLGAQRVALLMDHLITNNIHPSLKDDSVIIQESTKPVFKIDYKYELILVNDSHINKYLEARNLEINLKNMIDNEIVEQLDHYIWWLTSERVSYLLNKDEKPMLYIWHQIKLIRGLTILVGGWFVCNEECGPVDSMYALDQQLQITDKNFPGIPWVAVIKKTNRYVQLLNKRVGFLELKESDLMYQIAKNCFPFATTNEFYFYSRTQ